jgi:hypothetical protein
MKLSLVALALLFITSFSLDAKSRLGEYYLGFGYSVIDGGKSADLEGDAFQFSANSLASDSTDFVLNFSYGRADSTMSDANGTTTTSEGTTFNIGLDYVYHYDENVFQNGMFRPYAGLGLSYLSDDMGATLADDGFTWSFLGGTEILFTDNFSLMLGGRFIGLWSDFGENEFNFHTSLSYWITDVHGVALEYNRALDQEVDFITLKYLYSWQ